MKLVFSKKCIPYAEVATALFAKQHLNMSVLPAASTTTLYAPEKISSKKSIVRYFSRLNAPHLYESHPSITHIDDFISSVSLAKPSTFLFSTLSVADILLWDYLKTRGIQNAFVNFLELSHPEFKDAVNSIQTCLDMEPVNVVFKDEIAAMISSHFNLDSDVVFECIGVPNNIKHCDFSVAVPRLGLTGNPAQLAQAFAEQVRFVLSSSNLTYTLPNLKLLDPF